MAPLGHRFFLICGLALAIIAICPTASEAAEAGEVIPAPVSYITYVFTPGKLTGKEFTLEKTVWREFRFESFLIYNKPKDAIALPFSVRGYNPHGFFGHGEFEPKQAQDVVTGWIPGGSGQFLICPDKSKEHLPEFIPERTKLVAVPFIKQYGDKTINAYDLPLALDRVAKGEAESIPFQILRVTGGPNGVRLVPSQSLKDGVYYAYSLPADTEKYHGVVHGFLFAVGNPRLASQSIQTPKVSPPLSSNPIPAGETSISAWKPESKNVDFALAKNVLDYALLSEAVYAAKYTPINGWGAFTPRTNIIKFDLSSEDVSIIKPLPVDLTVAGSTPATVPRKTGFYAQAFRKGTSVVIAFAGTDDWDDVITDVKAFFGGRPEQYQEALNFVARVTNDCPAEVTSITLTGHSLGGGLASYAALHYKMPATIFNAAGLGDGLMNAVKANLDITNTVRNINLDGDPVSALGKQVGRIYWIKEPNITLGSLEIPTRVLLVGPSPAIEPHYMKNVITALQSLIK